MHVQNSLGIQHLEKHMHTVEKAYRNHIDAAQRQRNMPNLTPVQKARLTKRIQRLVRDLKAFKGE
jgi:hypothetical protein